MHPQYLDFTNSIDYTKLNQVASMLSSGGIGIFPTDTIYGIGCNASIEESILKLFRLKHRNLSNPINVLISNFNMLDHLVADITDLEYKLMEAFWPGPLTIIFHKKSTVSDCLTSGLDTIGIRMPSHPVAQTLIQYANTPIATTSANLSGLSASTDFSDASKDFKNKVDFMINDGSSPIGIASTIVKIENHSLRILREGSLSEKTIKNVLERS